jgi:molecular chaperone DnaK (HSP70)
MIGIDFGPDHCAVAVISAGGPVVASDHTGATVFPTAVAISSGGVILVGQDARLALGRDPASGQGSYFHDIGSDRTYDIACRTWTPAQFTSAVLLHLARLASLRLQGPPGAAVIAVPAWFHDGQRRAVAEAARAAGLELFRLINRPTAAALAFWHEQPAQRPRITVLDLWASGCDVSILRIADGDFQVLSVDGAELPKECDALELPRRIAPAVERALRSAGLAVDGLGEVLYSGPPERLALIDTWCRQAFGRPARTAAHPDQAVALGATLMATLARPGMIAPAARPQPAGHGAQPRSGCLGMVLLSACSAVALASWLARL